MESTVKKHILGIILAIAFIPAMPLLAAAAGESADSKEIPVLAIESVDGYVSDDVDLKTFFDNSPRRSVLKNGLLQLDLSDYETSETAQISDAEISYADGRIVFRGTLSYGGISTAIETAGHYYRNQRTANAAVYDNLILCEMEDDSGFHFVQLKFEKRGDSQLPAAMSSQVSTVELTVILQSIETPKIMLFECSVDLSVFDALYALEPSVSLTEGDLELKIIKLLSVASRLIGADDQNGSNGYSVNSSSRGVVGGGPGGTAGSAVPDGRSGAGEVWVNPFTDVQAGDWFYGDVAYAHSNKLIAGTGEDMFSPEADLTRAMLVTILAREAGAPTGGGETWYSAAVEWGVANGVTDGVNMTGAVTREQLAVILYRYAKLKGRGVSETAVLTDYADAAEVSEWAAGAMRWANAAGILTGRTAAELAPGAAVTRAEAAAFLRRFRESGGGREDRL
ncbi:MAG: S-layer homology domain-containing protein [Peptococcaceae bacterium]|jgi:hypothetical protein|nr:S-layer homology domain-containing protein [Peptococcaceae bacterium]